MSRYAVFPDWLPGAYLMCRIVRLSRVNFFDSLPCLWVDSWVDSQAACRDLHAHTVPSGAPGHLGIVLGFS